MKNRSDFSPSYLASRRAGSLKKRGAALWERMRRCNLCPRNCGANRLEGEQGFCRAASDLMIASHGLHFGEEMPLVGSGGSGAIFFSGCGLGCVFCINWEISRGGEGWPVSVEGLSDIMLSLQKRGCSNINTVTPTHYLPHILLALDDAAGKGLRLPLVYNTCGWERLDILKELDGIVDVYLPDFKYASSEMAAKYSANALSYPEMVKAALLEMHRQVGTAKPSRDGLIRRGLMIRHLVMPAGISGTPEIIEWIADNLPKDAYLNLMSQYRPAYKAFQYPELARGISRGEYIAAIELAKKRGLTNLDERVR